MMANLTQTLWNNEGNNVYEEMVCVNLIIHLFDRQVDLQFIAVRKVFLCEI